MGWRMLQGSQCPALLKGSTHHSTATLPGKVSCGLQEVCLFSFMPAWFKEERAKVNPSIFVTGFIGLV